MIHPDNAMHEGQHAGVPRAAERAIVVRAARVLALGAVGTGLLTLAVLRSRILADKGGGRFSVLQFAWDRLAGTWGTGSWTLAFLAGAALFSWLWLVAVLSAYRKGLGIEAAVAHTARTGREAVLLFLAGGILGLLGPEHLRWGLAIAGLGVLTGAGRFSFSPPDPDMGTAAHLMNHGRLVFAHSIWSVLLLALPLLALGAYRHGLTPSGNGVLRVPSVVLSFDSEEDWSPRSDMLRMGHVPARGTYFPTCAYVDSGILERLAQGLNERGIAATFYCTPNLVRARPCAVRAISELGHEIGLHLHMHNVREVTYPYQTDDLDDLTHWDYATLLRAMEESRALLERVTGRPVVSFRSGGWVVGYRVVAACRSCGFTSLSNSESTFRLPNGLWQIEAAHEDDVARPTALLDRCALASPSKLIPAFSHPMILYDRLTDTPREGLLDAFFASLDELRRAQPQLRFIAASQATGELVYVRPPVGPQLVFAAAALVLVGAAAVLVSGCPRNRRAGAGRQS
jgi:hypothetical protein